MKTKNIAGFLGEKKELVFKEFPLTKKEYKIYDTGYNQAITEQGEREITLDREMLVKIIRKSWMSWELQNKESLPLMQYIANTIISKLDVLLICPGGKVGGYKRM